MALRLDTLSPGFKVTIFSKEQALHAESGLRVCLEQQGYEVIGGQERYLNPRTSCPPKARDDATATPIAPPSALRKSLTLQGTSP